MDARIESSKPRTMRGSEPAETDHNVTTDDGLGLRILICDEEYLIALDGQALLQEISGLAVDAVMPRDMTNVIEDKAFDLVLLDPESSNMNLGELLDQLMAREIAIVFGTVSPGSSETWVRSGIPTVEKPYEVNELLRAFSEALKDTQPLKARAVAALVTGSGP